MPSFPNRYPIFLSPSFLSILKKTQNFDKNVKISKKREKYHNVGFFYNFWKWERFRWNLNMIWICWFQRSNIATWFEAAFKSYRVDTQTTTDRKRHTHLIGASKPCVYFYVLCHFLKMIFIEAKLDTFSSNTLGCSENHSAKQHWSSAAGP